MSSEHLERVGMLLGGLLRGELQSLLSASWTDVQPLLPFLTLSCVQTPTLYQPLFAHLLRISHQPTLLSRIFSYCTQFLYNSINFSAEFSEKRGDTLFRPPILSPDPHTAVRFFLFIHQSIDQILNL